MDDATFKKLVEYTRKNNLIDAEERNMSLSFKNAQKLRDQGFEMNEEVIEKLLDVFDEEKFEESKKKYRNIQMARKYISKPLDILVKIILLILFMSLIYFLTPSLRDSSQDRDDGDIYQYYYR